jgi:hypothetical protein
MDAKRYLLLHTRPADAGADSAGPALERYREELMRAGVLRDLVALRTDAQGARVRFDRGQAVDVAQGRLDQGRVLATFCTIETASREEALGWLGRWPGAGEGGDCVELRDSGCPGGVMAVIDTTPTRPGHRRYAVLLRANAELDAEVLAPQARLDAMTRRNEEGVARGVLVAGEGLKGSARGTRRQVARGVASFIDGPFTEIKEMVAGYWIVQVPGLREAIDWVRAYPYPFDDVTVDIREVDERINARAASGPTAAGADTHVIVA